MRQRGTTLIGQGIIFSRGLGHLKTRYTTPASHINRNGHVAAVLCTRDVSGASNEEGVAQHLEAPRIDYMEAQPATSSCIYYAMTSLVTRARLPSTQNVLLSSLSRQRASEHGVSAVPWLGFANGNRVRAIRDRRQPC